jgi:hypothetical protein
MNPFIRFFINCVGLYIINCMISSRWEVGFVTLLIIDLCLLAVIDLVLFLK